MKNNNFMVALALAAACIFLPAQFTEAGAEEMPSWFEKAQAKIKDKEAKKAAVRKEGDQETLEKKLEMLDKKLQIFNDFLKELNKLKKISEGKFTYSIDYGGSRPTATIITNLKQKYGEYYRSQHKEKENIKIYIDTRRGIYCILYDNKEGHSTGGCSGMRQPRTVKGQEQVMVAIAERALELGLIPTQERKVVLFDPGKNSSPKLEP